MSLVNNVDVIEIIEETARKEVIPQYRKLAVSDIREKQGPDDLVTIADELAEARLSRELTRLLPGSNVVGEEAVAKDASILEMLNGDTPVWILDPIDGTGNFVNGNDIFTTIVALSLHGKTIGGWIHDPVKKYTVSAQLGEGAYLGDRRLTVPKPNSLSESDACFLMDSPFAKDNYENISKLERAVKSRDYHTCCGLEYLYLATGVKHVVLYERLTPWDHAAGVLIHQEAGGHSGYLDGLPFRPGNTRGELLMAPTKEIWLEIQSILKGC